MTAKYCPICAKNIEPSNKKEVDSGEHTGYIYVHDAIPHGDDDIEAFNTGVN